MTQDSEIYHIPAMPTQSIDGLNICQSGIYADATFGGGGHSRLIINKLGPQGKLYGFDRDADALQNVIHDPRFTFVHSDFRYMHNFLRYFGNPEIDGIIADLGVSFHHFDDASRGFSFREDAPLDMRMNRLAPRDAAYIINEYSLPQLTSIFHNFGELSKAHQLATAIEKERSKAPISTTGQLLEILRPHIDPRKEKKEMAQIFQALRIEVNGEMTALQKFLNTTLEMLRPGGRLVVLTYHSLEDRIVKNFMRSGNIDGKVEKDFFGNVLTPWKLITRSPITADASEVAQNPRARSAKLRIAEKI